jgi:sulfonate transport system substrate-binding protein
LGAGAAAVAFGLPLAGCGQQPAKQTGSLRIGYQKDGVLVVVKQKQQLEKRLGDVGVGKIEWAEFPSGPPLLEALNSGGVDFGFTGDTPPIFAQSSGSDLVYVAAVPLNGKTSAILVPQSSKISTIAQLKGAKIAFTRGSSAHYLAVAALQSAGLTLSDVTPVYLAPADARAAFARGSLDAWSIWDPFYAAAQRNAGARVLSEAGPFVHTASYFLAGRKYADANTAVIRATLNEIRDVSNWVVANREAASALVAKVSGLNVDVMRTTYGRAAFDVVPVSPDIVARQQHIADAFANLKIIPRPIKVADAVAHIDWK